MCVGVRVGGVCVCVGGCVWLRVSVLPDLLAICPGCILLLTSPNNCWRSCAINLAWTRGMCCITFWSLSFWRDKVNCSSRFWPLDGSVHSGMKALQQIRRNFRMQGETNQQRYKVCDWIFFKKHILSSFLHTVINIISDNISTTTTCRGGGPNQFIHKLLSKVQTLNKPV